MFANGLGARKVWGERLDAVSKCPHLDKILGLSENISRRDFLDGTLMASAGMLTASVCPFPLGAQTGSQTGPAWTGYTGEGDYKGSAGNTEDVIQNAHAVRDGKYDKAPQDSQETGEVYDCVIVGGGFSGLSAGLFFHQQASSERNCLVLDNARIFGGVAKRNEFIVDGHRLYAPQASVHFQRLRRNGLGLGRFQVLSKVGGTLSRDRTAAKRIRSGNDQWQERERLLLRSKVRTHAGDLGHRPVRKEA